MEAPTKKCVVCGDPVMCFGYDTCGMSECQETRYYQSRARNSRKPAVRAGFTRQADDAMARVDSRKAIRRGWN